MRRVFFIWILIFLSSPALAQAWPAHPVRMVVPLSPGGFADVPARLLAPRLSAALGAQVFVENRTGAGGTIGADFVAKSAADGYTLLFTATPHVISPWIYKRLAYDALKDFQPVARIASGPYVLVVNSVFPVHSVRDLIAAAKKDPGRIDYASSGNGSAQHLVAALFASMAGIELNHVPYKGSGPAMHDLLAGVVKVSFAGTPNVLPQLKAGRLRALAVTTPTRWPELPEVPTLAQAGVPGYEATLWLALLAPAGTPAPIVERLSAEVAKALADPQLQRGLRAAGVESSFLAPGPLVGFMRSELDKWGRLVRASGAKVN